MIRFLERPKLESKKSSPACKKRSSEQQYVPGSLLHASKQFLQLTQAAILQTADCLQDPLSYFQIRR